MIDQSPEMSDADKAGAWQRLWATGAEDSFGQSTGEPPASAHWSRWFSELPQGASVLDLACGSGALLRRFLASNEDAQAHCHGVDLVPGGPMWLGSLLPSQRARIHFTGAVTITRLPFEDARFDAVVSQFGLEYADLSLAIPEALRVLRPNGRLGLLMHHQESRPVAFARVELEHADWLQRAGWLEAALRMCNAMALTSHVAGRQELSSSLDWAKVRHDYDELTRQVQARAAASSCPDLLWDAQNWMTQAFRVSAAEGSASGQQAAQKVAELISDTAVRLNDMLSHALSAADIEKVIRAIRDLGRPNVSLATLEDRGHLLGWWIQQYE